MTLRPCQREKEVVHLQRSGQWPQGCDPELRAHVASCPGCVDALLLHETFQDALAASRQAAHLEPPSLIWWRAQVRRRHTAMERVSRPFNGAQRFALIVYLLAGLALVLSQRHHVDRIASWLTTLGQSTVFHPQTLWSATTFTQLWSLPLFIPCACAAALLSGVVVLLVAERP